MQLFKMKMDFHPKSLFVDLSYFVFLGTVNKISNIDKVMQGLDIMSGFVLSLSWGK